MDVSIIIVNYNTSTLVLDCVDSIYSFTKNVSFEIIVVDNKSTDNSLSSLQRDNRFILIKSDKNLGFGKANNLGYKYSHGKYIFLLNSDTILLNNAILYFFDNMEKLPKSIACIGCRLLNKEGHLVYSYGTWNRMTMGNSLKLAFYAFFFYHKSFTGIDLLKNNNKIVFVDIVLGADLFIRRDVIEKFGFFDPRFFMYDEESDLQHTYLLHGYHSAIISGPKIVHLEGKSSISINRRLLSTSGHFTYLKKWNCYIYYLVYRILFFLLRLPIALVDYRYSWSDKWLFVKILFQSTKDDSSNC